MTIPLTDQQLAEYATAVAAYQQHAPTGFACCTAHPAADASAALLAEVHRLRQQKRVLLRSLAAKHARSSDEALREFLTAEETHVVADGSSDPAHTDNHPGCEPAV
ncbi:hypothetical protein ACH4ZX_03700 [Streptomyces sp. NPDC020490]|uniref:hypothetical protein n=1 Tax=Streptomyces sp. NPDC020490 TaxID=3365078 RepID=UPI00379D7FB0